MRRRCFAARELSRSPRARRLKTIHPEQLQLALSGRLASVYGYSFTDIADQPANSVEHFRRQRAQIEASRTPGSAKRCGACRPQTSTPIASG